ncbi:MAG: hypothetical protein ACT4ON_06085 [Bacteroidota bacterium]
MARTKNTATAPSQPTEKVICEVSTNLLNRGGIIIIMCKINLFNSKSLLEVSGKSKLETCG